MLIRGAGAGSFTIPAHYAPFVSISLFEHATCAIDRLSKIGETIPNKYRKTPGNSTIPRGFSTPPFWESYSFYIAANMPYTKVQRKLCLYKTAVKGGRSLGQLRTIACQPTVERSW